MTDFLTEEFASHTGRTWVSLYGEGPRAIADLVDMSGSFVDRAKLAYGSGLVAPPEVVREVLRILREADVVTYPGGTVVEIALRDGRLTQCFEWAREIGFTGIEICDGIIEMDDDLRSQTIRSAVEAGFTVSTVVQEVVRKPTVAVVSLEERLRRIERDLEAGATHAHLVFQALVRGETPADIVGPVKLDQAEVLVEKVGMGSVVFETLTTDDQLAYLRAFGSNVNLGHVDPRTVTYLETQRRHLGYEMLWAKVWGKPHWS